jgi:hypothetical protein
MASSRRPSKKNERRTTLTAMARATQRTSESPRSAPREREPRISSPPPPTFYDRLPTPRNELPPPYDDASGFIDLDKLREAALAEASVPSIPSVPASPVPPSMGLYQSRTAPPVAATLPEPPPPQKSGTATGIIVGTLIAAAGLAASFFIVSRGINLHDLASFSPRQQVVALKAEAPRPQAVAAPAPKLQPAAAVPAVQPPAAAEANAPAAAAAAVPGAEPAAEAKSALAAGSARDIGDIDSNDRLDPKEKQRLRRLRARRAKLRGEKADPVGNDTAATGPDPALAQALAKSADSNGAAVDAPTAAPAVAAKAAPAEEAPPTRPAAPAALPPPAGPPGLAAAIQKASGVTAADMPPAAAPAPRAAPPPGATGLPEAPSFGAVRSALATQLGSAKACLHDGQGASRANVTFGSDGRVQSVAVSGPAAGTPAEACIRGALSRATLAPFSRPTFSVAFTIRPDAGDDR